MSATPAGEHYGIDAPGVVRNLAVAGVALLLVGGGAGLALADHLARRTSMLVLLRDNGLLIGTMLIAMAGWMLVSSRWLKHRVLARLLDARHWRGDEAVLDIGCGRGLVAIGAARRLGRGGHVDAIDLWQQEDLSGNGPAAIKANAAAAGVADRLSVDTGDARALPYRNGRFDVVASMTAIHNIPDAAGRTAAIAEAWRVTRPGGQILIYDIRHARAYVRQLRALGATQVRMSWPILLWGMLGWRFSALKPAAADTDAGEPGRRHDA